MWFPPPQITVWCILYPDGPCQGLAYCAHQVSHIPRPEARGLCTKPEVFLVMDAHIVLDRKVVIFTDEGSND